MAHDNRTSNNEATAGDGQLVMVCGAARSGTTMVDLMLGNADDAFSTGEIFCYFRPFRVHHFQPVCSCGREDCSAWEGLLDVPEEQFHAGILRRPEYNLVVDSSKDLRWVLDSNVWARRNRIACTNVLIWKDPVDLAYSYWKRGGSVSTYRRTFLVYYERFLNMGIPFISVNYNDLAVDTGNIFRLLCDRLSIPFSQQRMRFWERELHYYFGSAGVGRQVSEGSSTITNKRDFPQQFCREYEAESRWSESNERFGKIIERLNKNDVASANPAPSELVVRGIKPLWYYRHTLKAAFRKHVPKRQAVVD